MDNGASSYRRFLDGDDNGLVMIIKDYKDGLILYLNSFVFNLTAAEELAEDTFVKIAVKKPRFKGNSSFKTWLYAIGRNVALDYLRRHKTQLSLEECGEIQFFEQEYIKVERKLTVRKALNQLKAEYRQIIWLVYFEDFSTKEAAEIMKRSVHSIETLLYRARQDLRAVLEMEGLEYEDL